MDSMVQVNLTVGFVLLCGFGATLAILVELIKKALEAKNPAFVESRAWARALPFLAPLIGALLSPLIVHDWTIEGVPVSLGMSILVGIFAGYMSGGFYSMVAQSLFNRDRRLTDGDGSEE
jgi:hypothetical protein